MSITKEEDRRKRVYYGNRGIDRQGQEYGYSRSRSYAEVVLGNESSEEERNVEEKKSKTTRTENERDRSDGRGNNRKEEGIGRKEYDLAKKGSAYDTDENQETTNFTNLMSFSTSTRFLTKEVRNIYNMMERRFRLAEERLERFQERQMKIQEEFFERVLQREKMKKSKVSRDKENDEGSTI